MARNTPRAAISRTPAIKTTVRIRSMVKRTGGTVIETPASAFCAKFPQDRGPRGQVLVHGVYEAELEGCGGTTAEGENEVSRDFRNNPEGRGQFSRSRCRSSLADTRYAPLLTPRSRKNWLPSLTPEIRWQSLQFPMPSRAASRWARLSPNSLHNTRAVAPEAFSSAVVSSTSWRTFSS